MKKLFLTSSFADVTKEFEKFAGAVLEGKTVTFIPTASLVEDVRFYVENDKNAFRKLGILVDELDVSGSTEQQIAAKLYANDYIFISGGNTFYLLQELKNTGTDKLIRKLIDDGKVYIGSSAGTVILAPDIRYIEKMDDATKADSLTDYTALNVVDFYPLPHHTNPPFAMVVETIFRGIQGETHVASHKQYTSNRSGRKHVPGCWKIG